MKTDEMIDWEEVAKSVGSLVDDIDSGGHDHALRAIEQLLGEGVLCRTADYYLSGAPGGELARSVLMLLRPRAVMQYLYNLYLTSQSVESRRRAVDLLSAIGDKTTLDFVGDLLTDRDVQVVISTIGLLDRLVNCDEIDFQTAEPFISEVEMHKNPLVQECVRLLRGWDVDECLERHQIKSIDSLLVH